MPLPKRDAAVYYNLTSNRGHYLVLTDGHVREPIGEAKTVDTGALLRPKPSGQDECPGDSSEFPGLSRRDDRI